MPKRQFQRLRARRARGSALGAGSSVLRVSACSASDVLFVIVVRGSGAAQSSCAKPQPFNALTKLSVRVSPSRVRAKRKVTVKVLVRVRARSCAARS